MTTSEFRFSYHSDDVQQDTTEELRELIPERFKKDQISLTYTRDDRYIAGGFSFPVSKKIKIFLFPN